uniref:Uncharacterized protein n=1 Tax=Tetranychus urticae TaxID=32264 RepID=T1L4E7_TETUR
MTVRPYNSIQLSEVQQLKDQFEFLVALTFSFYITSCKSDQTGNLFVDGDPSNPIN